MNVLHLAHRFPYPPDKGDRIRSFHTLRYLAGRARVYLACLADEPVPAGAEAELRRLCADVAVVPVSRWRWPTPACSPPTSCSRTGSPRRARASMGWRRR